MSTWKPIESAPHDGTSVILWNGLEMAIAYWNNGNFGTPRDAWIIAEYADGDYNSFLEFEDPIAWMEKPLPPK